MLKIKNTALDRSKTLLHRTAPKLEMEPVINGHRLRLNSSAEVTEEWAEKNKKYLEDLIKMGVIEVGYSDKAPAEPQLNADGLKLGGPTLEEFMKRGYSPENYPPGGWAEVPSAGLTAYRKSLADAAAAEAKAKEEAELAAMIAAEEKAKKLEVSDTPVVSDVLTATTEPAGAPAEVLPPPSAPAVEEKHDSGKKGPGKSKLK